MAIEVVMVSIMVEVAIMVSVAIIDVSIIVEVIIIDVSIIEVSIMEVSIIEEDILSMPPIPQSDPEHPLGSLDGGAGVYVGVDAERMVPSGAETAGSLMPESRFIGKPFTATASADAETKDANSMAMGCRKESVRTTRK